MTNEVLKLALEAWQTSAYGTVQHHKAMMVAMTEVGKAILAQPAASVVSSDRMAYEGAREDLLVWKCRALQAEALNKKFATEVNGQAFMGEPEQEPVACLVGIKGSAFDLPTTKRAYTYAEQPGNVVAFRIGRSCAAAALQSAGDGIDRGLALLRELQKEGFGVFDLGAEYAAASEPLAQPDQEPIYQYQLAGGCWIDQTKQSYDYNVKLGQAVVRVVYASPPAQPAAWYDEIMGVEVSMDVSTGEDDISHRVFGRVYEVMLESGGAQNDTILAIEDSRNFTSPPKREWVGLTTEDVVDCLGEPSWDDIVRKAEAKLKEKNT